MAKRKLDKKVQQLLLIYRNADAELEALVYQALTRGNLGSLRYRRKVQAQLRAIIKRLEERALPRGAAVVTQAYRDGAGLIPGIEGFGRPHQQAVRVLVDGLTSRLRDSHVIVGRRANDVFRRQGLLAVARKFAQAGTAGEATQRLIQQLEDQGLSAFTDKAGRNWSLETYASMVIRTTSREAATEGTLNRMHERGLDLVQISSHQHKTDICTPYDGKTFSLSGEDNQYPLLKAKPPFHPNCRHVLMPASANFDRVAAELGV